MKRVWLWFRRLDLRIAHMTPFQRTLIMARAVRR